MKKNFIFTVLILFVISTALFGCGPSNNEVPDLPSSNESVEKGTVEKENGTKQEEFQRTDLTVSFVIFGPEPQDLKEVEDEINKITEEEINVTVNLVPYSTAAYRDQIKLQLISGEKLDLFISGNLGLFDLYSSQVANGLLYPMNDLLEKYGQGIIEALGEEYAYAASIKGETYGVPQNRDLAEGKCFLLDKELAEKHNINVDGIETPEELGDMFEIIKSTEPKIYPFFPGDTPATLVDNLRRVDILDNEYGVLMNLGLDNTEVVNLYETEHYRDTVALAKDWADKGYIYPDAATTDQTPYELLKADRIFGFFSSYKPGIEGQAGRRAGKELVSIVLDEPWAHSGKVTNFMWSISHHCEAPEQAMRLLNLMYTNKDVMNLLAWGIEGKHYVKVEGKENTITYPEGVNADNSGYSLNTSWMFGNEMLCYVWEGDPDNLRSLMDEFNKNARKSKALGFTFDPSSVSDEIAAVSNVKEEYKRMLENGFVDNADETITEFVSKLKKAGIDDIIAEKQKQLDEWLSSR